MRYYSVTATHIADGSPHPFVGNYVSEWSLKSLRPFFESYGVQLHATHTHTFQDKPLYIKDPETGEIRLNQGEVV